jgi:hypothetical protein
MNDSKLPFEGQSIASMDAFPFPKLIQLFDYFFPKKPGAKELLTMENLKRFAPYAPFLALGLMFLMFVWIAIDKIYISNETLAIWLSSFVGMGLVMSFLGLLKWLGLALIAKGVRRSPSVALAMTIVVALRAIVLLSLIHLLGFVCLWMG